MASKDQRIEEENKITTYMGIEISPSAPCCEDILIEDIAHGLSLLCRGNGHMAYFYSVAQHSINCALEARESGLCDKVQLACLLHDGSEAYLADITRPVKHLLTEYLKMENILQNMIYQKFLPEPLSRAQEEQVKRMDDLLLNQEFRLLMKKKPLDIAPPLCGCLLMEEMDWREVKRRFISMFGALTCG